MNTGVLLVPAVTSLALVANMAFAGSACGAGTTAADAGISQAFREVPAEDAYNPLLPGSRIIAEALYRAQEAYASSAARSTQTSARNAAGGCRPGVAPTVWTRKQIAATWTQDKDWNAVFREMKSDCLLDADSLSSVIGRYYRPAPNGFTNPDAVRASSSPESSVVKSKH